MLQRLREILAKSLATRLRRVVAFFAVSFLLTVLLILAAPTILSSNFAQTRLKAVLSSSLHGPVEWSALQLSWSRGLQLHDFTLGPASGALRQARIGTLDCRPAYTIGQGAALDLQMQELTLELAPASATAVAKETPAAPATDPLTALAQALDNFATLSFPLPVDLRLDLSIAPITLRYTDPATQRRILFDEGALKIRTPSLKSDALTLHLDGKLAVDDHPLGVLTFATEITKLVAPSGRIVPAGAQLTMSGRIPGISVQGEGSLAQGDGFNGELHIDLPALQQMAAPFLPADLPTLEGTLLATLQGKIDQKQNLDLRCTLAGRGLTASGGQLPAAIGPLNLDLAQGISTDQQRRIVTFSDGHLQMPPLISADWRAEVSDPNSPQRRVSATLQSFKVDLDQTLALAVPFLPSNLPQISGGEVQLRDLDLQLRGTNGDGELNLAEAQLQLSALQLQQAAAPLHLNDIKLAATGIKIPLKAYFPTNLRSDLSWQISALQMKRPQQLTLQGLSGRGDLQINAIEKGVNGGNLSAQATFNHQLRLKTAAISGLARIDDLASELQLSAALSADGIIKVGTMNLKTDIAALIAIVANKELLPMPVKQDLSIDQLEMRKGADLPQITGLTLTISSPQAFSLNSSASLSGERTLTMTTHSELELPRLLAIAAQLTPKDFRASGSISSDLSLVATIPDRLLLPTGKKPLRSAQAGLALLDELSASLHFNQVELHAPIGSNTLHLSNLQTPQPFRLQSSRQGNQLELNGVMNFDLLSSTLNGQRLPTEHLQLTINSELQDWDRAFFAEKIEIEPLGLVQQSELTITGLAATLDTPMPHTPAFLLQRLNATLFSELDLQLRPEDATLLLPGLQGSGRLLAGSRIDLTAGDNLQAQLYSDVDDLTIEMEKGVQLAGLTAHLDLNRSLKISSAVKPGRWRPLSTSLVQPQTLSTPPALAGDKRRLLDDLRGSHGGERSLLIKSVSLPVAGIPLRLTNLEADLVTGAELGLNFLQVDLLGGTLRSQALIDLRPVVPVLAVEARFTNLDLDRLGGDNSAPSPGASATSISGEGRITLPLLSEERALLEGLNLQLNLRDIGSQTFDRTLARLDPYERNEAIQAQRKTLRRGELQWVNLQAADGALAMSGAISVSGINLALPKIERLRLAELSLSRELAPLLRTIDSLRSGLEFTRTDTIQIAADGKITLGKEEK